MIKKIFLAALALALYLSLSYLLQPKLREVLRVPQARDEKSDIRDQKEEPKDQVAYDCEKGKTAYELLLRAANNQIEVKEYPFGKLVDRLNGLKGGTEGKYWIYFVEGKSSTIGADAYRCQDREKIEWKFVKPQ